MTDFLKLNLELDKGLRRVEVAISKKRIFVGESTLLDLLDWAMLVKLRPALVNFLAEVINYSVDITKLMMNFLFSKGRSIVIDCNIPQLCL